MPTISQYVSSHAISGLCMCANEAHKGLHLMACYTLCNFIHVYLFALVVGQSPYVRIGFMARCYCLLVRSSRLHVLAFLLRLCDSRRCSISASHTLSSNSLRMADWLSTYSTFLCWCRRTVAVVRLGNAISVP